MITKLIKAAAWHSLIVLPVLYSLILVPYHLGVRITRTGSLPGGVYIIGSAPAKRGDIVVFELFQPYRDHLMKKVAGLPGDSITINDDGVYINGEHQKNSKPYLSIYFKVTDYVLGEDEVLLLSDYTPLSFDGRYFGTTERKRISNALCPLYLWNKEDTHVGR